MNIGGVLMRGATVCAMHELSFRLNIGRKRTSGYLTPSCNFSPPLAEIDFNNLDYSARLSFFFFLTPSSKINFLKNFWSKAEV